MLPYGLMVEVTFIYELAIYVARLLFMQRRTFAQVRVSYESMIGYTADLVECLYGALVFTCCTHVHTKVSTCCMFCPLGDDAVIRAMIGCGHLHIHRGVCEVCRFTAFIEWYIGNCWAKMQFSTGTLTTFSVERLVIVIERMCVCHRTIR
jgi:hypothetical protein